VIKWLENVIRLPVLALVFYPIKTYQVISLCWSGKYKFSFHIIELKCHYCDETDVDVLNVFYCTKMMSDTETDFL
jgi:hypothetical protein